RAAIADVVVPEVSARVTASIGLAQRTSDMRDAADMLEAADTALYTAKRTGRDRVAVAEPASAGDPAAAAPALAAGLHPTPDAA
ncbi:diguanylate cyclase domain-containing protein, partial [Streptococcus pyogenes]|uniref:diguanylate cyclase domain-containing protein n=1 Tax=Streptococcus pyogenes TaxID=1314 RepID=UPI003DA0D8FD